MNILGVWRGILCIDGLNKFIEDEYFEIEILSIDDVGNVRARVVEEKQPKGLTEIKSSELETNILKGRFEGSKLRLANDVVTIEADIGKDNRIIKGVYFKNNTPDLKANIELKKIS